MGFDSYITLANFLAASVELMQVLARACGHNRLNQFTLADLTTWKHDMAWLSGVSYGGVSLPPVADTPRS